MMKYSSILMLLTAFSFTNGSGLPESDEAKIQRYNSIATDLNRTPEIRLSYADRLLNLQRSDLAAHVYDNILKDPRSDTDLDLQLLAIDGLGRCGITFKGRAVLIFMAIVANPTATDEQKETARAIFEEWNLTVI